MNADTPPPAGGSYLRDAKTGALTPVVVPQDSPAPVAVSTAPPIITETAPPEADAEE